MVVSYWGVVSSRVATLEIRGDVRLPAMFRAVCLFSFHGVAQGRGGNGCDGRGQRGKGRGSTTIACSNMLAGFMGAACLPEGGWRV